MGRESANYFLTLAAGSEEQAACVLDGVGAERLGCPSEARIDFCLRDEYRYWIDLRIHREPQPCLEIRVALTNDQWSIRVPLELALSSLASCIAQTSLRDEDGTRWNRDNDEELAWHREREIARMQEMWEIGPDEE